MYIISNAICFFRYYEDLKEENSRYPGKAPFPWLEAQFKQLGLDVYR